ncbi:MAG: hypothetical protein K2K21_12865 [Lachnospiraceae bacterium]|nr:hypothetical protein [Lachnospiraceae bacterium]
MHIRKVIVTGVAAVLLVGSTLSVSAAGPSTSNYVKELKKSGKESLIIDVEAYKAAYSDLAAAFGDNDYAYIEHYLTVGVFEGRTKGVLFDPLVYAAAYGDVGAAFGNDISAIVDHYINFGAAENRTYGTANGYADIATAQKVGSPSIAVQRSAYNTNAAITNFGTGTVAAGNAGANTAVTANGYITSDGSNLATVTAVNANINSTPSVTSGNINNTPSYNHTTSIYGDNEHKTLLRVEYYDDNNKLYEYSDVVYSDKDTNSYTETVYRYDEESKEEIVTRTDTYVNGELVSSENH